MTYGTTQSRSECDMPATEGLKDLPKGLTVWEARWRAKRTVKGSRGHHEGLGGQLEDLGASQRVERFTDDSPS